MVRNITSVNLPCHVILVKPGCGVTVYLTVAVRALELFPASEKAVLVEIQTGSGAGPGEQFPRLDSHGGSQIRGQRQLTETKPISQFSSRQPSVDRTPKT